MWRVFANIVFLFAGHTIILINAMHVVILSRNLKVGVSLLKIHIISFLLSVEITNQAHMKRERKNCRLL